MNIFLIKYFEYCKKYIKNIYPNVNIVMINIDNNDELIYQEDQSPLHNSVIYLNKKILNSIRVNSNFLEIGCGVNSIFLNDKSKKFLRSDGLDVHEKDFRGRNTIANIIGSVSQIPTRSNFYDYCISNQSIEHWFEYGVKISKGLSEIARILKKDNGRMIINFPLFLHGKKEFVKGDLEYIINEISKYFNIEKISFVYSGKREYEGWRKCGQSLYRVTSHLKELGILDIPNSFVCEVIAIRKSNIKTLKDKKINPIFRLINLYSDYSIIEIFIKLIYKLRLKLNKYI